MDTQRAQTLVEKTWDEQIVPQLTEYIRIPNKSPMFDPQWRENGHMEKAVALIESWCRAQPIQGMKLEVVRLEGRTPVIYAEIPGQIDRTVLLYGHLDKQPEMSGWEAGLGPWVPVLRDGKLYGRGGADDGYSAFASLTAIRALQEQGIPHGRCVMLIEACEESGSYDLPFYVDHLAPRIGSVDLVICLDSGCGNYDQLWSTTSLRGLVGGNLVVETIKEGVHSGDASGVVASSFRVLRILLSRIEDEMSGRIVGDFQVDIPKARIAQAELAAKVLGADVYAKFPFHPGVGPMSKSNVELVLNRTWRAALSITGAEGLPALRDSGNVLRPKTAVKISLRIPPTLDARDAQQRLKKIFESNPPYGAKVRFEAEKASAGWNAPALAPWLEKAVDSASRTFFGKPPVYMGEGGTIPFMGMLGERFPEAQFLITGLLGPNSNAHGPNEFLHIQCGKRLTSCVSSVLAQHYTTFAKS
ncbi:MAG: M20 family metallopeptidase [Planctomycetes bacterium]|nr:M20 family metallopeptidase [Planctomycetota bacterium]